ncbi:MAG: bifunctional riboflavin kinase/FAD synthetase [Winogradskyella sp.]|uniref:bifunctional riboflavin kinase/FAD synthetase n=1 Tax=Winogradskyella sp. TaxID=1883156 RepID=UPI00181BE991|nr:bifunctional riboflavin kinase/FAD synthetase [Winogradskyella sp.]MBT8246072.1 bifunctional riboflavin kinase/FAD synthetase [Winogradskyella sp.]NNK23024.1 bifunctional riboflavin kinase/FAD synthetase [Winogradskyella sp.]
MSLNNDLFSKTLTIGTFDGVHIGHQKILEKVVNLSQANNQIPSVLTFFPHPRMVLHQDKSIKLLNTISERKLLLEKFGIELICVKTFTKEFSKLSAEEYVKGILIDELNAKQIVIGYDHHFGKNRSANITDLKKFAKEFNFEIEEISAKDIENVTISSTKIRNALVNGNVSLANSYLGYNYFLTGRVVKGQKIGRTLDFPTANIYIEEDYKLIPKDGVYVVKAKIEDTHYFGMMNIGLNPTIENKPRSIEVHFFDFKKDVYGKQIVIEMLTRLRDEHKFNSIDALKTQLKSDKKNALAYIKSKNEYVSF